jgi:pimeloyl-ACP methyl ester carboxylesterase
VRVEGIRVDVRFPDSPDLAAPAIVLVHGAMDRLTSFGRVRRQLTEYVTVAYDRRGYAESVDLAPSGTQAIFDDHVDDLVSVLDTTEALAGRPVVLVGHSYGANIVFGAAIMQPDQVVGVVGYEPPMPWTNWWPSTAGGSTIAAGVNGGPEAAAESFMRRIVSDDIWDRLPTSTKDARRREGPALLADLGSLRGRSSPIDHAMLQCRSVVGFGGDSWPHQKESARITAALLRGSVLVELPGTPHGAHIMNPVGFADLVRLVLKSA